MWTAITSAGISSALRHRIGDQHAAVEPERLPRRGRSRAMASGAVEPERRAESGDVRDQKAGITSEPIGDDRHAARLQHLQRLFDVEDRLGAGRHHDHRRARQFVEIGRDVEARLRALVHAADAARGEDADAGDARARSWWRRPSCRRCGPRATAKARSARDSFIAPRRLRQRFALAVRQADLDAPVDHRDRGRRRAFRRDDRLDSRPPSRLFSG